MAGTFGVITGESGIAFDQTGRLLISGSAENVSVWSLRQGSALKTLVGPRGGQDQDKACAEVTCLARAPGSSNQVAVGYSDGTVRIWDVERGSCEVTLSGHKTAVTGKSASRQEKSERSPTHAADPMPCAALRYDKSGSMLASGSKDTDVVLWDVPGETGLFRLRGHTGQVTDLVFLSSRRKLVTASKDNLVKVWDLDTQHCCQTVIGHRSEVWSLDVDPSEKRVVTGSADAEIRVFHVLPNEGDRTRSAEHASTSAGISAANKDVLEAMGSLRRQASERVQEVRFSPSGEVLGVLSAGKLLELFKVRSDAEVAKHLRRRKKRRYG